MSQQETKTDATPEAAEVKPVRKTSACKPVVGKENQPAAAEALAPQAVSEPVAVLAETTAVNSVAPLAGEAAAEPVAQSAEPSVKRARAAKAAKPAKVDKAEKAAKPQEKAEKTRKSRLVRDSYAMPDAEYQRIGELKKRLSGLGVEIKKSELLRCGIAVIAALNDDELKAVVARVERVKTGRPRKK